jgi:chromatin segregation and condensation protein Rec8/ScpA/Scc1 (kleisin family)
MPAPSSPPVAAGPTSTATPGDGAERFPVDVPGFEGPLEQLVARARRGEIDLAPVSVSAITAAYRTRVVAAAEPDAQELADFLTQASRLVALKAAQVVPDTGFDLEAVEGTATDASPVDDPGSRLAEYRRFRAAVDVFLADATGEASCTFLASVGPTAAAVPTDSPLTISQERLVGALRGVLARLPETPPATIPAAPAVSVEERCTALRILFAERDAVPFEELFATATATSRPEGWPPSSPCSSSSSAARFLSRTVRRARSCSPSVAASTVSRGRSREAVRPLAADIRRRGAPSGPPYDCPR